MTTKKSPASSHTATIVLALFVLFGTSILLAGSANAATTTIWSNDLETNNFSGWTSSVSERGIWEIVHNNSLGGSYHTRVSGDTGTNDDILRKQISTVGYDTLSLSYKYKIAAGLEPTDHVYVEWTSDGSDWHTSAPLANYTDITAGGVTTETINIPSGANNAANFAIRFRAHLNAGSDDFRLDDVVLTGTTIPTTATLTLVKQVTNDNGGTAAATAWTLVASSTSVRITGATGATSITNATVAPGTFNLSEAGGPSGYSASSWVCTGTGSLTGSALTLVAGNSAVCTITNNDIQPKLTVTKVVINDNGGTKVVSNFPLSVGTTSVTSSVQSGFNTGTYTVSETGNTGYAQKFSGDCSSTGSITLGLGDVKSCTITNDDIAPKLTVTKTVINNDGGTKEISDFPLFVGEESVTSGIQNTYNAGTYTVSETSSAGYIGTIGGDCAANGSITLNPGDIKTCTITNNDIAPGLTVIKTVTNDNGGTLGVGDFTLYVGTTTVTSGQSNSLSAGSYVVSENATSGYVGTIGGDCDADGNVTLGAGETKVCTITNDDIAPSLTLVKTVNNNAGGEASPSDWMLTATGNQEESTILSGEGGAESNPQFQAGTYTLSESGGPQSYEAGNWSCTTNDGEPSTGGSITLVPGDVAICSITNTYVNDYVPPTDVCTNINGVQETVPSGMTENNGVCTTPEPVVEVVSGSGGGNSGSGGSSGGGGQVLGAAIGPELTSTSTPALSCEPLLTKYIKRGAHNNVDQVKKLQTFLNSNLEINLPITGFYGPLSFAAVKSFQGKYTDHVIKPWNDARLPLAGPTGYVYKTTSRWINILWCSLATDALPVSLP